MIRGWRGAWRHQLRWARTIRFSKGWGYLGLPITHAGIWAIAGFALHIWLAAVILLVARIAATVVSGWLVLRIRRPLWHALLAPLWDLCAFSVWAASYASTEVQWRGRRLRILRNGRVENLSAIGTCNTQLRRCSPSASPGGTDLPRYFRDKFIF